METVRWGSREMFAAWDPYGRGVRGGVIDPSTGMVRLVSVPKVQPVIAQAASTQMAAAANFRQLVKGIEMGFVQHG